MNKTKKQTLLLSFLMILLTLFSSYTISKHIFHQQHHDCDTCVKICVSRQCTNEITTPPPSILTLIELQIILHPSKYYTTILLLKHQTPITLKQKLSL